MNTNTASFPISSDSRTSAAFLQLGISTFGAAVAYIKQLPYARNADKEDHTTVLHDGLGTCSTKHALLRQLAIENDIPGVTLELCIFKMHAGNIPPIAATLAKYQLPYMPEAHNYLVIDSILTDCTKSNSSPADFINDILGTPVEVQPHQVTGYKVQYHKDFLSQWLAQHPETPYSLTELYQVREQCIQDMSKN